MLLAKIMADETKFEDIRALIERIERDAYQRGRRDAAKHIVATATDAVKAAEPKTESTPELASEPPSDDGGAAPRATRGAVPRVVRAVLNQVGENGVTAIEAYERARAMEPNIAASSIRARLRRLVEQGVAQKTGKRWFLTTFQPDVVISKQETAGIGSHPPAAPSTPNQGEP